MERAAANFEGNRSGAAIAMVLCLSLAVAASARADSASSPGEARAPLSHRPARLPDPVLYWNDVALGVVVDDHSGTFGPPEHAGPGHTALMLAIVHVAIHDAVTAITGTSVPYMAFFPVGEMQEGSVHAAVGAAAYETLSALYPAQREALKEKRDRYFRRLPRNSATSLGNAVGAMAGRAMMIERREDGSQVEPEYIAGEEPGLHREDPLNPGQSYLNPAWGSVVPFVIPSGSHFRSPPPPALDSPEYAEAFDEVRRLGGDGVQTPTERTPEQTEIALFWAYDGSVGIGTPPRLYNQIARVIAEQQGNTIAENARLFALLNVAMADASVACWESKYVYNYWRPIIGIREADPGTGPTGRGDGNPATVGDPQWRYLGSPRSNEPGRGSFTPNFPSYPSGHATFGGAAFRILALFYGTDEIAFTFTSDELNGVTLGDDGNPRPLSPRSFSRLSEAAIENADSRVYLGVHWRFDSTAGLEMGEAIADYVYENAFRPVNE